MSLFNTYFSPFSIYSKKHEADQVTKLYGSNQEYNTKQPLIDVSSGSNYFARGHLAPDASFIYSAQQDATYYFANVAPQYQACNNGNWKALEGAVRDYAAK